MVTTSEQPSNSGAPAASSNQDLNISNVTIAQNTRNSSHQSLSATAGASTTITVTEQDDPLILPLTLYPRPRVQW